MYCTETASVSSSTVGYTLVRCVTKAPSVTIKPKGITDKNRANLSANLYSSSSQSAVKMLPPRVKHVLLVVIATITRLVFAANNVTSAISEFPEYIKYPPRPLVCIKDGCIIGANKNGLENGQFEAFFGIPYAKPPLGKLRFKVCFKCIMYLVIMANAN